MVCIYCGARTSVTNSRHQKEANQVWRRRQCVKCKNSFTTHEALELGNTLLLTKDGSHFEPFSSDKLFVSIYESCKHRPTAITDARGLTQTIIARLRSQISNATIDHAVLLRTVVDVLSNFDKTAKAVYAAYHTAHK